MAVLLMLGSWALGGCQSMDRQELTWQALHAVDVAPGDTLTGTIVGVFEFRGARRPTRLACVAAAHGLTRAG